MKKVLIIIKSLETGGGAEKAFTHLANELSRIYDVKGLVFHNHAQEYEQKIEIISLNEKPLRYLKFYRLISRPLRIIKLIRKEKPDVVVSFMREANIALLTCKLLKKKTKAVCSIQNNVKKNYRFPYNFLAWLLYPLADSLICASEGILIDLPRKVRNAKYINNPIDPKEILEQSKEHLLPEEKKLLNSDFLINIGRLEHQKNQEELIDVFKIVSEYKKNLNLLIIGEGKMRERLQTKIEESGLKGKIHLLGKKKNVYKYLSRAKLTLSTSFYEGLPLSLLESIGMGIPIITYNFPYGPSEIICEKEYDPSLSKVKRAVGILVPFGEKEKMAREILFLLNNKKELEDISRASKKRSNFFDIRRLVKDWKKVLDKY